MLKYDINEMKRKRKFIDELNGHPNKKVCNPIRV